MAENARIALGRDDRGVAAALLDAAGVELGREHIAPGDLAGWVADREATEPVRWVWNDTDQWYPALLREGVAVARCHDLRLNHAILRGAASVRADDPVRLAGSWDQRAPEAARSAAPALFDWGGDAGSGPPASLDAVVAEMRTQDAAVHASVDPARLRLLLAAESAGALLAAELADAGVPWDAGEHDRILTDLLGPRGADGRPVKLEDAAARVRAELGDPAVNLDSQPRLLRALHRAGIPVQSTSRWDLAEHDHPAVAPLLEYKKLARLLGANGWTWLAEWVREGRFRPVYVPGGVVTGRWASSGGGALQLPRQLRSAVRADPGWTLVVADVAQLEPRVLAGMSRDASLARAAAGRDLYEGIVAVTGIARRADAKIALLGAMYGATTGESGRLLPHLRRSFPRAMALVDAAARTGEDGGSVSTLLGRTSPPPGPDWLAAQARASEAAASAADIARARRAARERGRFTRNFVVQGTAAEWALAWLADLRSRLAALPPASSAAPASGPVFGRRAHAAFFLHDEVIVHAPAEQADAVAAAVGASAASAARLLFGGFPIDFPLDVRIAASAVKD